MDYLAGRAKTKKALEFGESTFKKTSADSIAKRASISKGLLFHYFKDKRELYLYLFQHALDVCVRQYMMKTYDFGETDFFCATTCATTAAGTPA